MTQLPTTGKAPAASLVGSLSTFSLAEILNLLSNTRQSGELQVAGIGCEGRLWLDMGDLAGSNVQGTETLSQALFQLALLREGWFYFTNGQAPPAPLLPRRVNDVLIEVLPLVDEWHELLERVPLDAMVNLSVDAPAPEVQIRGDQWHVLTTLGTRGRTVQEVVDALPSDPIVTLRVLRELWNSGLVELESPVLPATSQATPAPPTIQPVQPSPHSVKDADPIPADSNGANSNVDSWPPPPHDEEPVSLPAPPLNPDSEPAASPKYLSAISLAGVAIIPPTVGGDTWNGGITGQSASTQPA